MKVINDNYLWSNADYSHIRDWIKCYLHLFEVGQILYDGNTSDTKKKFIRWISNRAHAKEKIKQIKKDNSSGVHKLKKIYSELTFVLVPSLGWKSSSSTIIIWTNWTKNGWKNIHPSFLTLWLVHKRNMS